eukprot:3249448-Pyramimonas_sp.AAC.1
MLREGPRALALALSGLRRPRTAQRPPRRSATTPSGHGWSRGAVPEWGPPRRAHQRGRRIPAVAG